jgi:aryl-alcohol dehydrogenase-like predicted oxidoreductase
MFQIVIGTANWNAPYGLTNPVGLQRPEVSQIVEKMITNNISIIDTAVNYFGSQELLREILRFHPLKVTTKIPHVWAIEADNLEDKIKAELDFLNLDKFESILLHDPVVSLKENPLALNRTLESLLTNNYTQRIGISVYTTHDVEFCLNKNKLISEIQFPINPINQTFMPYFKKADKFKNFTLVARSVFMQGLLTMKENNYPAFFRSSKESIKWNTFLQSNGVSGLQTCLIYLTSLDFIDRVIFGVNSVKEFSEIIDFIESNSSKKFHMNFDELGSSESKIYDPRLWKHE